MDALFFRTDPHVSLNLLYLEISEVFMAVTMKNAVFWDVTQHDSVGSYC
jgi:hypothetical protein